MNTMPNGSAAAAIKSAVVGCLLSLALPLAIRTASAACPDDFAGPALATPWSFVDADGTAGGAYALSGGKLELTGRGRDAYGTVNEFVGIVRSDITGDFDVSVKLESQVRTHDWAQAGILAAHDPANLSQGGYVVLDVSPANGYTLFYDAAAPAGSLDKLQAAGVAAAYPSWLRLAKAGAKFTGWYRKQATDPWIPIGEPVTPQGTPAPSRIALFSLSHDQGKDGKAVFDDFACLHLPTASGARGMRDARNRAVSPVIYGSFGLTGRRVPAGYGGPGQGRAPGFFLRP
jgi:hypothetical protein